MASLFQKFQEAVKVLARNPTLAKNGRQLQFQADINRLFLYTCYNRLGKNAGEADAEEIIDMASKASLSEQEKQVQENIHEQVSTFCKCMDGILLPDSKLADDTLNSPSGRSTAPKHSGLRLAVGSSAPLPNYPCDIIVPSHMHDVFVEAGCWTLAKTCGFTDPLIAKC